MADTSFRTSLMDIDYWNGLAYSGKSLDILEYTRSCPLVFFIKLFSLHWPLPPCHLFYDHVSFGVPSF